MTISKARRPLSRDHFTLDTTVTDRDRANCGRKRTFITKQKAKQEARIQSRNGQKITSYECPVCHHFHLTKADVADERERRG